MKLDFSNALAPAQKTKVLEKKGNQILKYLKAGARDTKYSNPFSALYSPFDTNAIKKIKALAKKKLALGIEHSIICGIGGSVLGTQAVLEACFGPEMANQDPSYPETLIADTLHPRTIFRLVSHVLEEKPKPPLITIISKSGSTTETTANAMALIEALKTREKNWKQYVVVITNAGSKLALWAEEEKIDYLEIPKMVGGRFSVFTSTCLFPLALAGINIDKFVLGAKETIKNISSSTNNIATKSAAVLAHHAKLGINIHNLFIFAPPLLWLGNWYRQLAGESLGKQGKGLLPVVSIGTQDLHSTVQVYLDGPKKIFTTFVRVEEYEVDPILPDTNLWDTMVPGLSKKNINGLVNVIAASVEKSYKEKSRPFADVLLKNTQEKEIGAFMAWKMCEIIILGHIWDLGAATFTQDAVELYKKHVKQFLANKSTK